MQRNYRRFAAGTGTAGRSGLSINEEQNGGLATDDAEDYAWFKQSMMRKSGINLDLYKQHQMHRRLRTMLERAQVTSFKDYFALLERDPKEYAAFLDRMTINVSELFRNPEKWEELRTRILPTLPAARKSLKVWSAGCSYGAEPYSLAILLDQVAPGQSHTIHATDLDRAILEKARQGRFTRNDVKNLDAKVLSRYFTQTPSPGPPQAPEIDACYQVNAAIRDRVTFKSQNLLADSFDSSYDLICCRNVVIYFTDPAKDALYARFHQALKPGGVLFVGGTERIFNYHEIGFDTPVPFFYRRV